MENRAITIGRLQVEFEAIYTGKDITEKELRGLLLPKCAQADLSSDAFEYLAKYLTKKLVTS